MSGYQQVLDFLALPHGSEVTPDTHYLFMNPDWHHYQVLLDPAFKAAGEPIRGEVQGWRIHADFENPAGTLHYGRSKHGPPGR